MKFTNLKFLVLALFFFSACQQGADLPEDEMEEMDKWEDKLVDWDIDKEPCFDFVYPITYTMPDGTTVSGGEEEVDAAIKEWYENNAVDQKPELVYPIQIVYFDNDMIHTIEDDEGLELAWGDCFDSDWETDELTVCDWDGSLINPDSWVEYVVKDLVVKDDCGNCFVDGIIKFVHASENEAYVIYYGKGECDNWAFLVHYENLNTDQKSVTKCKFEMDCQ